MSVHRRRIGVVTVARSDYGIYLPILHRIRSTPALELEIIASGMHLAPQYGLTLRSIEADGFKVAACVDMLMASDTPGSIAKSLGIGVMGYADYFSRVRPDILVVLGDRFEMFGAALAALPFRIPVAHIHGGEITQGAIDDALRHAMTKLSHLHFVSTQEYARRVIQLGEEPWRVTVCGAPGLDHLNNITLLSDDELRARYHINFSRAPLLVTYHPVTLESEQVTYQAGELLAALQDVGLPVVFTLPNADTGSSIIQRMLRQYVQEQEEAWIVDNFGTPGYFSMMAQSSAMVGNSSSGIIEAASFKLPVVNIGTRQQGRVRSTNVIDVGYGRQDIADGLARALDPRFRDSLQTLTNPYRADHAASELIVERLQTIELDAKLTSKPFFDITVLDVDRRS